MAVTLLTGDVREMLKMLPDASVQVVCTSPPYFRLRSYLPADHPDKHLEMGSEQTPAEFVAALVAVFEEVRRVLRPDGCCFVNLADSYAGSGKGPTGHNGIGDQEQRQGFTSVSSKSTLNHGRGAEPHQKTGSMLLGSGGSAPGVRPKSLMLVPQRFVIAMQDAGWIVRDEIVWAKKSAMPESVRDRCTKAWEPIFMFTKSGKYFWDSEAVRTPVKAEWSVRTPSGWDTGEGGHGSFHRNGRETSSPTGEIRDGGANLRNVWHLSPEPSKEQHYASFPTEIPRRCILAATSEKGQCPACGSPWVRIVERTASRFNERAGVAQALRNAGASSGGTDRVTLGVTDAVSRKTLSWQPGCACSRTTADSTIVRDFVREWFGGNEDVYRVWEGKARQAFKAGADKVLLPGVRQDRMDRSTPSAGDGVQEGEYPAELSGRQVHRQERIRVHPSQGTPDGESEWLRAGAPSSMGAGAWSRGGAEGDGHSSPERHTEGQPSGESTGNSTRAARDVPSHPRGTGATPAGGSGISRAERGDGPYLIPHPACPQTVLDIFLGTGTTALVADRMGRNAIGIDLNPEYVAIARRRIESDAGLFADVSVDGEARTATTQLDLLEVAG